MGHVSGGMLLLFPFSWDGHQLGLIQCDDCRITLILINIMYHSEIKNKKFDEVNKHEHEGFHTYSKADYRP